MSVPAVIEFNRDVRPILTDRCYACHGPDKNKRKADLRLDTRELLLRARPKLTKLLKPAPGESRITPWEAFMSDEALQRRHMITAREMQFLSKVAALGEVKEPRDFIFILIAVRFAIIDRYPRTEGPT